MAELKIPQINLSATANLLMNQFPGGGYIRALERASQLLEAGNLAEAAEWTRLASAMCEIELAKPEALVALA